MNRSALHPVVVTLRTTVTLCGITLIWSLVWLLASPPCREAWRSLVGGSAGAPPTLEQLAAGTAGGAAVLAASVVVLLTLGAVVEGLLARVLPSTTPTLRLGPVRVQRFVLIVCGLGLPLAPATATAEHSPACAVVCASPLAGLQLPDLPATGPGRADGRVQPFTRAVARDHVAVRSGDSLWLIAERLVPPDADLATIAAATHRLYVTNRAELGDNPDLIHPGTTLDIPHPLIDSPEASHGIGP